MNPRDSLLWCFIHMLVHIGSVLDMVVVFLEILKINHCSYVQHLILSVSQYTYVFKSFNMARWWIVGWRLCWCWKLSWVHWTQPLHPWFWTRGFYVINCVRIGRSISGNVSTMFHSVHCQSGLFSYLIFLFNGHIPSSFSYSVTWVSHLQKFLYQNYEVYPS